jgi:hypothetical protein
MRAPTASRKSPAGLDRLEASFDDWSARLVAEISEARLLRVSKELEQITSGVLADRRFFKSDG